MSMLLKLFKPLTLIALLLTAGFGHTQEIRKVKLGLTESQSGEYQPLSASFVEGVKFWASDLVDRGGNPIDLVIYDDKSDPELAAQLYERLITEDKVDLLIGPFSSSLVAAVAPVVEKHQFPMVVEATAPVIFSKGYKNIFGIYTPAEYNMHSVLDMAAEKSLNTLAIGYQESDFPTAVAAGTRRYAPEKGLTIVYDESYPVGSPDMQSFVTAMAKTRPDIIVLGAYLDDSVAFMKALKATGYAPKMLAISGAPAVDDFGIRLGSDTDGVIATTQWMRDGRIPMSFDFGYRYKQLYGHYPSYNAAGGYASGQITEAAARLAVLREVIDDPVQIRARMREKLSTMRFQSLLGNYRPDATGQQSGKEIYVIQWQWPHRSLIAPTEIARWELKFPFPAWEGRQ